MKVKYLLLALLSLPVHAIDVEQCNHERQVAAEAIAKYLSGVPLSLVMDAVDDYREQTVYVRAYRWNGSWDDFPHYIENMCYRRQLNID